MTASNVRCPSCRAAVAIDGRVSRGEVTCPDCGRMFPAPAPAQEGGGWYYARGKQKYGPVALAELRRLTAAGQLAPADMVLKAGTTRWCAVQTVPGLFTGAPGATAVPPTATGVVPPQGTPEVRPSPPPGRPSASPRRGAATLLLGCGRRLAGEGQAVAAATVVQTGRLLRYAKGLWRRRSLRRAAAESQRALGRKMHECQIGNASLRDRLARLQANNTPQSDKRAARIAQAERDRVTLQLADSLLRQTLPPRGVEVEHGQARKAMAALREQEEVLAAARNDLAPRGLAGWTRVGAGYGAVGCLLVLAALWTLSPRSRNPNDPQSGLVADDIPQPAAASLAEIPYDDVDPEGGAQLVLREVVQVDPLGNARFKMEISAPADDYGRLKRRLSPRVEVLDNGRPRVLLRPPTIKNVIRFLSLDSSADIIDDPDGQFDDAASAIRLWGRYTSWACIRDGQWVSSQSPDPTMRFAISKSSGEVLSLTARSKELSLLAVRKVVLPPGSAKARIEDWPNRLVYSAPAPVSSAAGATARPRWELNVKPHLISALYKLYADPRWGTLWAARSVFHNTTGETLSDYRVRYRIRGYTEDWSGWERYDIVYPGQTVVDVFYPNISRKVVDLRDPAPADIDAQYSYVRPGGERVNEEQSERTRFLGINEGVFTDIAPDEEATWHEKFKDAPMVLAAFATPNDPVIQDLVGRVHRAAGSRDASEDDEAALRFLEALYKVYRRNINYKGAQWNEIDGVLHQRLEYGREVLHTKSGTCVNLAILYATAAEAAGLEPYVFLIHGHAFPGVALPHSKRLICVETTGCGDGTVQGSYPFIEACKYAKKKFREAAAKDQFYEANLKKLHAEGMHPPQLSELGGHPLRDWGIVVPDGTVIKSQLDDKTAMKSLLEDDDRD